MAVGTVQVGSGGVALELERQAAARPKPPPTPAKQNPAPSSPALAPSTQQMAPPSQPPAPKPPPKKELSPAEYLAMLRRMNLTYDLFEIQANYRYDKDLGMVRVVVKNTVTGEVIRRIPPYEPYRPISLHDSRGQIAQLAGRIDLVG